MRDDKLYNRWTQYTARPEEGQKPVQWVLQQVCVKAQVSTLQNINLGEDQYLHQDKIKSVPLQTRLSFHPLSPNNG